MKYAFSFSFQAENLKTNAFYKMFAIICFLFRVYIYKSYKAINDRVSLNQKDNTEQHFNEQVAFGYNTVLFLTKSVFFFNKY